MGKALATNMDASLEVPTATSVRTIPAKLMIDNRIVINSHLSRTRGGKVSFTHIIGYAIIRALKEFPSQNVYYDVIDGKPAVVVGEVPLRTARMIASQLKAARSATPNEPRRPVSPAPPPAATPVP